MVNSDELLSSTVRRLGSPVSTILLHTPSCQIFSVPDVEGVIGYQKIKNCAVVIGDPVCLPEHAGRLTKAFHAYCQMHDLKMIFLLASEPFAQWAINNGSRTSIQVGEELFINPVNFRTNQKLRWKISKSLRGGIVIKEYRGDNPLLESQMKTLIETWKKARQGPQIYLGNLDFSINGVFKRIFYASQDGKIVGLLMLVPVDRLQGWVINAFLTIPGASQCIPEHVMCSTIETLANENCRFFCLGAVSGSHLGEIVGLNHFSKFLAHLIFKFSKWYFKLNTRAVYLYKFHPSSSRMYLLLNDKLTSVELMAIKQILNVKL